MTTGKYIDIQQQHTTGCILPIKYNCICTKLRFYRTPVQEMIFTIQYISEIYIRYVTI